MKHDRIAPPPSEVPVLGRILGAVLAGAGTLANIAIRDLWHWSTASIPLTILFGAFLYGAIFFAQLQGARMVIAKTPADLSFTPRIRALGIGVVATLILSDVLLLAASLLGLI